MRLSLAEAREIADRGISRARDLNLCISIAVVDEFAQLVQLDRMDEAVLTSPEMAEAMTVTAMKFRLPTSELTKLDPETLRNLQGIASFKMLPLQGAVLIVRGTTVVGAVGVSGASHAENEEIAAFAAAI